MTSLHVRCGIFRIMKAAGFLAAILLPVIAAGQIPADNPRPAPDLRKLLQEGLFEEEANRNLDAASIRRILTSTARDLGAPGHDDKFGAGLVDAFVAVEQATPKATDVSAQTPRSN